MPSPEQRDVRFHHNSLHYAAGQAGTQGGGKKNIITALAGGRGGRSDERARQKRSAGTGTRREKGQYGERAEGKGSVGAARVADSDGR